MALVLSVNYNCHCHLKPISVINPNFRNGSKLYLHQRHEHIFCPSTTNKIRSRPWLLTPVVNGFSEDSDQSNLEESEGEVNNLGVKAALSMLRFYKREISPLLPNSCRYIPTCSEYSMIAYKKYGVVKGTVLTAWRLCRCNPFGGSGFDPPRWFDEASPPDR